MYGSRVAAGAGVALVGAAAFLGVGALRPVGRPAAPTGGGGGTVAGEVVAEEGARFAVGLPGDVVVVADWTCSQRPTAAVLRPSTGGLFVFDGWPAGGVTASAVRVHAEPGGTTLAADAACGRAVIRHPDGTERIIPTTPASAP